MIARAVPLLFLTILLGLLGCRDTLVDEPLPTDTQETPADTSTINEIYLKGPVSLRVGETRNFRAEPLAGVDNYRWSLSGGFGVVSGTPVDARLQYYDITGIDPGPVTLTVQAFDENGDVIGIGTKSISVIE
jgi:hypothetical protein